MVINLHTKLVVKQPFFGLQVDWTIDGPDELLFSVLLPDVCLIYLNRIERNCTKPYSKVVSTLRVAHSLNISSDRGLYFFHLLIRQAIIAEGSGLIHHGGWHKLRHDHVVNVRPPVVGLEKDDID